MFNLNMTLEKIVGLNDSDYQLLIKCITLKRQLNVIGNHDISYLTLPDKYTRLLRRLNIHTVNELLHLSEEEFYKLNGVGDVLLNNVKEALNAKDLDFF